MPETFHVNPSFFLLPSDFSANLTLYTSMLSQQRKNGKRSGYANQGFLVYSKSCKSEPLHAKIGKSKNLVMVARGRTPLTGGRTYSHFTRATSWTFGGQEVALCADALVDASAGVPYSPVPYEGVCVLFAATQGAEATL